MLLIKPGQRSRGLTGSSGPTHTHIAYVGCWIQGMSSIPAAAGSETGPSFCSLQDSSSIHSDPFKAKMSVCAAAVSDLTLYPALAACRTAHPPALHTESKVNKPTVPAAAGSGTPLGPARAACRTARPPPAPCRAGAASASPCTAAVPAQHSWIIRSPPDPASSRMCGPRCWHMQQVRTFLRVFGAWKKCGNEMRKGTQHGTCRWR